jgi:protoporphyrinogen IX oxidase
MYAYIKAIHIIFVVTWFAGMFYLPRLFIYNTEAEEKPIEIRNALHKQFAGMMKPLWYGITWPSAILTLILGLTILFKGGWYHMLLEPAGSWLLIKLFFVAGLYGYHFSLQYIYNQQIKGIFAYSSQQLRIWNELATIFLVAIVIIATVKENMSWFWGLCGLLVFVILLLAAIRIYKRVRSK